MPADLRRLRYFVVLVEEASFTRAALRLHLTQQALSAAIARLERELGFALVSRGREGVRPTPAGTALLDGARQAIALLERALADARRAAAGQAGLLRIGVAGGVGPLDAQAVRRFAALRPDVPLHVRPQPFTDTSAGLRDGAVDVAFVRPPLAARGLEVEPVVEEARVAVLPAGHALAGVGRVPLDRLFDEPWYHAPATDPFSRGFWLAEAERGGLPARLGAPVRGLEEIVPAVVAGAGIGLTARSVAAHPRPGVAFAPVEGVSPCTWAVAWRAGTEDERIRDLAAAAHAAAA